MTPNHRPTPMPRLYGLDDAPLELTPAEQEARDRDWKLADGVAAAVLVGTLVGMVCSWLGSVLA